MKATSTIIGLTLFLSSGCSQGSINTRCNSDNHAGFHNEARGFWKKNGIKGLAVAIFNNEEIIWKQTYGKSTYGYGINDSTMFSLQSVSKNITALAILLAVEEGLLDLDTPISNYLTGFSFNSCFQENPEEVITLRMLLSNTAGLPHEAPVGNNFDYSFPSIEAHIKSIENVWLKFTPGSNYSYSNLGFDLAAHILESASNTPFDEFLDKSLFSRLQMFNSTFNDSVFISAGNISGGEIEFVKTKHYPIPLIGSGAAYSSLNDMVNYVQMHLNYGEHDGEMLIKREALVDLYKVILYNYGLGTYVDTLYGSYYLNHNGGGFGYGSSILWFPEYNVGCVVLANKQVDCFAFASAIISKHIATFQDGMIRDTIRTNDFNPFDSLKEGTNGFTYCKSDSIFKTDWEKYLGSYEVVLGGLEFKWYARLAFALGKKPFTLKLSRIDSGLWLNASWLGKSKLYEYQPGLFFTKGGRVLDLRNGNTSFDNLKIVRYRG